MTELCYDPYDKSIHDDPYPLYRRLRDEAPVSRNPKYGFYALARYDDVRAALADHETFSSARGITLEDLGASMPPAMIAMDPPDHTRLRRLISATFTPKRVTALEEPIRTLTRSLLDEIVPRGRCDVIKEITTVLPVAVICELMGVPSGDQPQMRAWTEALIDLGENRAASPDAAMEAGFGIQRYFEDLVAERRKGSHDGDDIIRALMAAREGDDRLSHEELIGFLWLLLVAGNDTSNRLLGNAIATLAALPDQRRRVVEEPALIAGAVDETLRYEGAAHMIVRTTARDATLHDVTIPAGTKVGMLLACANRDERRWPDPDVFDIDRNAVGALGFGHGIHHCLGAPLGRLETRVALEEILPALGEYTIDHARSTLAYSSSFRGYEHLILEFEAS